MFVNSSVELWFIAGPGAEQFNPPTVQSWVGLDTQLFPADGGVALGEGEGDGVAISAGAGQNLETAVQIPPAEQIAERFPPFVTVAEMRFGLTLAVPQFAIQVVRLPTLLGADMKDSFPLGHVSPGAGEGEADGGTGQVD